MDISEEPNTRLLALPYDNKKDDNTYIYSRHLAHVKLYIAIPPSSSFYQWNDIGKSCI
jgi:hypothetical protein